MYRIATLALVLATSTAAFGRAVSFVVGGKPIFLHTSPVARDGMIYVPLVALHAVGAEAKEHGTRKRDEQKVEIVAASGRKFSCKARLLDGELMVPIREIAQELGAIAEWDEVKNTMTMRARLENIEFDGAALKVRTSYPVAYDLVESKWTKLEKKLVLDVAGVRMPRQSDLKVENSTSVAIRIGTREDGETGRIVVDMPHTAKYRKLSGPKTTQIVISVSPPVAPSSRAGPTAALTEPTLPPKPVEPPAEVTGITHRARGPNHFEVEIAVARPVEYTTSMPRQPDRVVVDLENAKLVKNFDKLDVDHSILQSIRASQWKPKTVRVVLDLTRVMAFDIRQDERARRLTVILELPRGAGGLLSDKIIVIDPGHGGSDKGARGHNGLLEKNINLPIALRVEKLLKNAGACVLMTRKSDRSMDLKERPRFANRHSADLFVSIHNNALPGTQFSGTEAFYHQGDSSSRSLAECVHSEVVAVNGLPDRCVKSDYEMYAGKGLAVLRLSEMPGVLLETAFIDHPGDAACLTNPQFQQKVAEAIVRGLKAYVEDNPTALRKPTSVEPVPDLKPTPPALPPDQPAEEEPPPPPEEPADETSSEPITVDQQPSDQEKTGKDSDGPSRPKGRIR